VPSLIRIYLSAHSWFSRLTATVSKVLATFAKGVAAVEACFIGLWMGVLSREELHAVDEDYYTSTRAKNPGEPNYYSTEYNRRGLWDFEKKMLDDYFKDCKSLLVIAAGGGREVLALQRLGYQVDGFESHPGLVHTANELLQTEGEGSVVHLIPRDSGPNTGTAYDGILVGWGAYMLVQGRKRRIALLRQLRSQTNEECPILLSFYVRHNEASRAYSVGVLVANAIRRALGREPAEVGDWLVPYYVHYLTHLEVANELSEGGFKMVHFSSEGYGHAVGIAV
jgi:hypothetical protein